MDNKLHKIFLALFVMVFTFGSANAQSYVFKVLAASGNVKVAGQSPKIGATINTNDAISLGANSYLSLVHKSKKTIELRKAGQYTVNTLEKQVAKTNTSLTSKYGSYLADELTNGAEEKSRYSGTSGTVERGVLDAPIQVMLPPSSQVLYGSDISIRWYMKDGSTSTDGLKFTIEDFSNVLIQEKAISSNEIVTNLKGLPVKDDPELILFIMDTEKEMKSGGYNLTVLTQESDPEIFKEYNALMKEYDGSAVADLILAEFFEEKGLMANAVNSYEKALRKADLEPYQNLYKAFLDRNGMSKAKRESMEATAAQN